MSQNGWSRQPVSSIQRSRTWIAVIIAAFVLILIRFLGISAIQSAHAFYDIATVSIQGTVEDSQETTDDCSYTTQEGTCVSTTSCSTTVSFTPPNQSASFTATDDQCDALAQGTTVEVLYDPYDPSIAKTARQASADVANAIIGTLFLSVVVLIIIIVLIMRIYYKKW